MDILEQDVHKRRNLKLGRKKTVPVTIAARLILADSVEVDHDRPGILTEEQFRRLKAGEYFPKAHKERGVKALFPYFTLYRYTDLTCREATIKGQKIIIGLNNICAYLAYMDLLLKLNETKEEISSRKASFDKRELFKPITSGQVEADISLIAASRVVLRAASECVRVKLYEDIDSILSQLQKITSVYNDYLATCRQGELPEGKTYKELCISPVIRPTEEHIRYVEERIDLALGTGWRPASYQEYAFSPASPPNDKDFWRTYPIMAFGVFSATKGK